MNEPPRSLNEQGFEIVVGIASFVSRCSVANFNVDTSVVSLTKRCSLPVPALKPAHLRDRVGVRLHLYEVLVDL